VLESVVMEFGRLLVEGDLRSTNAIIKHMAKDPAWRKEMGLGRSEKEVQNKLSYLLTERLKQPEIFAEVLRSLRDRAVRAGVLP
jgi:hypothetical protein